MAYQNQQVINATGGAFTISNTTQKEYVSLGHYAGGNVSLNNTGVSIFSPNNYQIKIDNDAFITTMGDHSAFYNQNSWERVIVDKHILVGDSTALHTNAYDNWSKTFSDISSIIAQPDTSAGGFTLIPGLTSGQLPQFKEGDGTRIEDPAITELKNNSKNILNDASILPEGGITPEFGTFAELFANHWITSSKIQEKAIDTINSLKGTSPSTQGGTYKPNTAKDKLDETISKTQNKLTEIENQMGEGGNLIENIARNKRVVVGASVNTHPQAVVNPIGRQSPSCITVGENGINTQVIGVPEVNEVDNSSIFPCGNYNIEVGNRFNVSSGGGGITLATTGSVNIHSDVTVKLGSYQVLIGGKDIVIKGNDNISLESDNFNITCPNQIVLNGSVGIGGNLLLKGGAYVDGELYVHHITAPLEIQQTLPGFTAAGAYGFLRTGGTFSTTVGIIKGKITIDGVCVDATFNMSDIDLYNQQVTNSEICVELTPHAHEFVNIPLTLAASGNSSAQGAVRNSASLLNTSDPAFAQNISNGSKYPIDQWEINGLNFNDSSTGVHFAG